MNRESVTPLKNRFRQNTQSGGREKKTGPPFPSTQDLNFSLKENSNFDAKALFHSIQLPKHFLYILEKKRLFALKGGVKGRTYVSSLALSQSKSKFGSKSLDIHAHLDFIRKICAAHRCTK